MILLKAAWYIEMSKTFGSGNLAEGAPPLSLTHCDFSQVTLPWRLTVLLLSIYSIAGDVRKASHCAWHIVSTQGILAKSIAEPAMPREKY